MPNPLLDLQKFGQAFWLDNIHRAFTRGGGLKKLIDADGLRGVTSNPTIFQKAVAETRDYDEALKELIARGKQPREIYDELTTTDVRDACDVFRPLYDSLKGADGYVSLELPPQFARDTNGSIQEAHRLWNLVDRPNLFVKVPATDEGMPVIRQLLADGINVNITLMFGEGYYEKVIEAFMHGLEDRLAAHRPLHSLASVASCFVSRVDTEVDKRIEAAMQGADPAAKAQLEQLLGKAAIANSKRLYRVYKTSLATDRWRKLEAAGARRQRPLWASTSTKNPKYPDTYYVEALIGPETVDTMPPATIDAFRDHGKVEATLDRGYDEADECIARLAQFGVSLKSVTDKLLEDGLVTFQKSYDELIDGIKQKCQSVQAAAAST
jgi:transaldolase